MKSFRVVSYFIYIALTLNLVKCATQRKFRVRDGILEVVNDTSTNTSPTQFQRKMQIRDGILEVVNDTSTNTSPTLLPPSSNTTKTYQILSEGITRLALGLNSFFSEVDEERTNVVFSPLNIAQTISTVILGTAGQTEIELTNLLGMAIGRQLDNKLPKLHEYLGNFFKPLTSQNVGAQSRANLNLANGVFIQRGFVVKRTFIDNSRRIYNNDVRKVDFKDGARETTEIINKWVADKTNGKITQIVDSKFDPGTKAIIVGVLYFNGDWEYPFLTEFTKWQNFYLGADGKHGKEKVSVEMMAAENYLPSYENPYIGFSAIGIPYKKKEEYMFVILPKLFTDVKNLTNYFLTPKEIENIVEKSMSNIQQKQYIIPKMKLDSESSLCRALENLGARTLFDRQKVNFSNIADGIYVENIIHKVSIDINEVGTTAAAATVTGSYRMAHGIFRVDRPFIFFIYDTKIGVMTFWGVVHKPTPYRTSVN